MRRLSEEHKAKLSASQKGRPKSEETKRKMSEFQCSDRNVHRGKHLSEEMKKLISEKIRGRKHSPETKAKIAAAQRGPLNHNWQGGKTSAAVIFRNSPEYVQWRNSVYARDNYTCQWPNCEKRGGKLNADHIKSFADYPELRLQVSNGRTLCRECHKKTDNYGNRNRRMTSSAKKAVSDFSRSRERDQHGRFSLRETDHLTSSQARGTVDK